ncbi:ABC transporter substrate-binding protein [Peterkaempfera sp. SMS 1(5)a]|uniref:ABC transporter substrate-binding protein n=1 Tax=Peterkaempfera podocarpi TaxID=3232308 RepID=UPI00366BA642
MSAPLRSRALAAAATALCLGLTASACASSGSGGSGTEGNGKGTITFWDNNGGPDRTPVWKKIIADFEAANPGIKVEYVGIPTKDVQQKYDTAAAGGGLPDVGGVGTAYLADLAAQGVLEPLDDRLATSSLNGKIIKSFEDIVRSSGTSDKLFAVPTSANLGTIWYRTDLFQAAGLQPPTTWDAFYAAAQKLTDPAHNHFGFTIRGGAGSVAQALEMMYAQSGVDTFWNGDTTTVNDPRNVAALEKYVGLYKKATPSADVNNDYTKMVAQFDNGDIGMMQHNLGSYQNHIDTLGKDKIDGVPLPSSAPGSPRTAVSNPVDGIGLFKTSKNKEAAWKFIEFAASHTENSYWNEKAGSIPANTDAATDSWIKDSKPTQVAQQAMNDPNTKIVQLPYYLPEWNSASKAEMEPVFQKLLLGQVSAKDFCDQFAEKLNKAQADWKQRNGKG